MLTAGEHQGAADYFVSLGKPRDVNVTGDRAYVVVPATTSFKVHGKPARQTGSTFIVALRKLTEGWRITAWLGERYGGSVGARVNGLVAMDRSSAC